jgi:GT2 family glycosyltransferase
MRIEKSEIRNLQSAMTIPLVSVVLVNFNGRQFLPACLASLAAQTGVAFEIIFVDNASTDDSVEFVCAHFPPTRVIVSPRNVGFAAGNNLGIRASHADFVATLNVDAEAAPDWLAQLIAAAQSDPRIGSVASLMLRFDAREIIDSAGITVDRAGIGWNLQDGQRLTDEREPREVFGASAGAALYRRAMLDEIGLFDEAFFAFYEDTDLAWRARRAGWKCVLAPTARVYHVHGGSFGKTSDRKLYLLARNKWWTILKNYPLPRLAEFFPWIALVDFIALGRALVVHRSLAPLAGRVDATLMVGRVWKKRQVTGGG